MEGTLRVVHVNSLMIGGAAIAVQRIHGGLLRAGCDSSIFTLTNKSDDSRVLRFKAPRDLVSRMTYRWQRAGIEREFSAYRAKRPEGIEPFSSDRSEFGGDVLNQMSEHDIAHLHWVADFVDYRAFFSAVNKPIVWTLHDMNPFTGGCHYNMGCDHFRIQCGMCPQLGGGEHEDLSRQILKRKQHAISALMPKQLHIVATSKWMQQQAQSSALFSQIPVSLIPLGVDTDLYSPRDGDGLRASLGIPKAARVVLFAAESIENKRKGFSELLQALAMLDIDEELFLLTVGGNSPTLNGHFNHIHLGFVDSSHLMSAIYSSADVFVIPSLQEAFGQTALEAMACGTPVAGFAVGGIVDTVRHGETGYLAAEEDVKGLCEGISRLLNDTGESRIMGRNARRMVENEYNLQRMSDRHIRLYQDMLELF